MIASQLKSSQEIGLLVSVRDEFEAGIVRNSSVDVLDIKEPDRGSLGRPAAELVRKILAGRKENETVSVALGELRELDKVTISEFFSKCGPDHNIGYAKIGLSNTAGVNGWQEMWRQCVEAIPPHIASVAVAYADQIDSLSPSVTAIIESAKLNGCSVLLLDTFDKKTGNLFHHLNNEQIFRFGKLAAENELKFAVAGSVSLQVLPALKTLRPDWIGVRGAVCESFNRSAKLSPKRLHEFANALNKKSDLPIESTKKLDI